MTLNRVSLEKALARKELFLFDLDGVIYKGKEVRVKIGGTQAVGYVRDHGKKLFVLTNNSTDSVDTIRRRLSEFGVRVQEKEILTSALLTARYLKERQGVVDYFLVGEDGLEEEMRREGHRRVEGGGAEFVVVGLDRRLSYEKLDRAARLAREGAGIVATHDSRLYMSGEGPALGPGPLVRAIEFASGKRATVIGKPSPLMFRMALSKGGCAPAAAVMVGDQLETDYEGARKAGVDFILVRTGVDRSPGRAHVLATLDNVDAIAGRRPGKVNTPGPPQKAR
jgi:HAD superfamily hydrolase (TIGR01450 family)